MQKNIKLDQRIAKNIWIWSNPSLIALKNIINNFFLILFLEIVSTNFNSQILSNLNRINRILICSTVSFLRNIIFHKPSHDLMPLLFQKIGSNSRINTSGKSHQNFHLAYHIQNLKTISSKTPQQYSMEQQSCSVLYWNLNHFLYKNRAPYHQKFKAETRLFLLKTSNYF